MRSLRDQIKDTCIHFRSPIHCKKCSANINYRELVGGPSFGWMARLPCIKNSPLRKEPTALCAGITFPDEHGIEVKLKEWEEIMDKNGLTEVVKNDN